MKEKKKKKTTMCLFFHPSCSFLLSYAVVEAVCGSKETNRSNIFHEKNEDVQSNKKNEWISAPGIATAQL